MIRTNRTHSEAMSEITSISIRGMYKGRWEDLILTAEAAEMAGTSPQAAGQRIANNGLATAWLPGTKSSAIRLLVRREWEELIKSKDEGENK